jgi:hypothetical protein
LPADPRQRHLPSIGARLSDALGDAMHIQTNNTTTGFHAAAVDLGRLKSELERGIQRLDMDAVRGRWTADIRAWMTRLVFSWVQRAKELNFDLRERGIHLRIETQDDAGYYHYAFDVMPGRKTE